MSEPEPQPTEEEDETPELEPEPDDGDEEAAEQAEEPAEPTSQQWGTASQWIELDKALEAYITKAGKIVGPGAPVRDCAHCQGRGFTLGYFDPFADFEWDDTKMQCERCKGKGQLRLPSEAANQQLGPCGECGGQGWKVKPPENVYQYTAPQPVDQPSQVQSAGVWVPGRGFIPYGATEPIPGTAG